MRSAKTVAEVLDQVASLTKSQILEAEVAWRLGEPGMRAVLVFDLNTNDRACIATRCALTLTACPHGYTWQCPKVVERYLFMKDDVTGVETPLVQGAFRSGPER